MIFLGSRLQERLDSLPASTSTLTASRLTIIPRTFAFALILTYLLSTLTRSSTPVCDHFLLSLLFWLVYFSTTQCRALPRHLPSQLLFDCISPYHYPKNVYICTYLLSTLTRSRALPCRHLPPQLLFDHISPYHYPKNVYICTYLLSTLTRSRALPCRHLPPQLLFDRISPYHYSKNVYICTYLLSTLTCSRALPCRHLPPSYFLTASCLTIIPRTSTLHWSWPTCFLLWSAHQTTVCDRFFIITFLLTPLFPPQLSVELSLSPSPSQLLPQVKTFKT